MGLPTLPRTGAGVATARSVTVAVAPVTTWDAARLRARDPVGRRDEPPRVRLVTHERDRCGLRRHSGGGQRAFLAERGGELQTGVRDAAAMVADEMVISLPALAGPA